MSKRVRLCLALVCVLAGIAGSVVVYLWWDANRAPPVERTVNKDRDWHERFLKARLTRMMPDGQNIQITGRIFSSPVAETRTVPVGFTFENPDDDGGGTTYTFARIEKDGVRVKYTSTARLLGQNMILQDTGSFTIKWCEPPA